MIRCSVPDPDQSVPAAWKELWALTVLQPEPFHPCTPTFQAGPSNQTRMAADCSPTKLPRLLMPLDGDLPRGEPPLGLPPLGLLPRGERPCSNSSSAWGSGTDAKRAGANTCVGCRKAPPRPFTIRCSGSKGCRLAVGEACSVLLATAWLLAACAAQTQRLFRYQNSLPS